MMKLNDVSEALGLSDKHAEWLERRGIPSELAAEIGMFSRGLDLAFPYSMADGSPAFTKWRKPQKDFRIEPSGQVLLPWLLERMDAALSDTLIWTEGEIDALSFLAAGAQNVTSVPNGATGKPGEGEIVPRDDTGFRYLWDGDALRPELARFKRHILATDGDAPGQVLRDELAIRLGRKACWFVTYPAGCKDANDVLAQYGREAVLDLLNSALPIVPDRLVRFSEIPRSSSLSMSSGWGNLDPHLMISLPELMVIGGPPNHGKSQFSLALLANLARVHGMRAAIIQFEDSVDRHREDLERYARAWQHGNGALINVRPEAWIDDMFVTIAPPEAVLEAEEMTLDWLKERIHEAATRHGCKVILIDPWNEVEHLWGGNESETAYTGKALRQIKALAKAYDLLVIVVTHPSKSGGQKADNEELTLYDLAGSAHWNNKPDHGIMIRRQRGTDETLVNIAKCRDFRKRGVPGQVLMRFDPKAATFNFVGKA